MRSGAVASLVIPAFAQQQTRLYDRIGGLKGISMVVDDFIDRLVSNEILNRNPALDAARKSSPARYLKVHVATFVCEVSGGP